MNTVSVRDFRTGMASVLNRSDAGEQIVISRGRKLYAIVPIQFDDLTITPSLQAKIDKAKAEMDEGTALTFSNASEAQKWMDEL